MSIEEYLNRKKSIQRVILEYLEEESNIEESFENINQIFKDHCVLNDYHEFKELLYLINDIGNNHRRINNFYEKIERIVEQIKNDITKTFKNSEIFDIFKDNKRLLLFLIEEEIIKIDEFIVARITSDEFRKMKYCEYFSPEIKQFINKEFIDKYSNKNSCLRNEKLIAEIMKEQQEDFYEKRKKGENDSYLCELIRTQQTENFIIHVNKTGLNLDSYIEESIFETNVFMIQKNEIKIIEYAAFFGSNEIIRYMHYNGVMPTSFIWYYAIHSEDAELIKHLEDNKISPPNDTYETILRESIKCYHNDASKYIINNLFEEEELKNDIENEFYRNLYRYGFQYHNYCFFPESIKYKNNFYYSCEFNYYNLVSLYLEHENIDINATFI